MLFWNIISSLLLSKQCLSCDSYKLFTSSAPLTQNGYSFLASTRGIGVQFQGKLDVSLEITYKGSFLFFDLVMAQGLLPALYGGNGEITRSTQEIMQC